MYFRSPRLGLGAITSGQVGAVSSGASSIAGSSSSNLPTSTKIESGIASALFTAAALTPPPANIALAIAGGVSALLATLGVGSGCGETCVLSTAYANKAEEVLSQNVLGYFGRTPRTRSAQTFALNVFDAVWNDLVQQCSNPNLGDAGKRCISDRQRGSCQWRQRADSVLINIPGEPQVGECWNWHSGYRDPIANDPNVVDDAALTLQGAGASISSAFSSVLGNNAGGSSPLWLLAGLGAIAWGITR